MLLGDVDLFKIYLGEVVQNSSKVLTFKIDETSKTASLFKVDENIKHIVISRTVLHKSTEYLITSITGTHYDIETIKFEEDSAVETIYHKALTESQIEELYFPASMRELKEGWCNETKNLKRIIISPSKDQFILKKGKYLIGKTDPKSEEFDNLLFAVRDIKEISIPSNIKIISPYAFNSCRNLTKVKFRPDSNLQTIESQAFSESGIEEIYIPSKVSEICENAFSHCRNLKRVEIPPDSNLQTIGQSAFFSTTLEEIYIPQKVSEICERAFSCCEYLTRVEIPPDSNLQTIGLYAFSESNIEEFFIQPKVSLIYKNAFLHCKNLQIIEISEESEMNSFQLSGFLKHLKVRIMIPSALSKKWIQTNYQI